MLRLDLCGPPFDRLIYEDEEGIEHVQGILFRDAPGFKELWQRVFAFNEEQDEGDNEHQAYIEYMRQMSEEEAPYIAQAQDDPPQPAAPLCAQCRDTGWTRLSEFVSSYCMCNAGHKLENEAALSRAATLTAAPTFAVGQRVKALESYPHFEPHLWGTIDSLSTLFNAWWVKWDGDALLAWVAFEDIVALPDDKENDNG